MRYPDNVPWFKFISGTQKNRINKILITITTTLTIIIIIIIIIIIMVMIITIMIMIMMITRYSSVKEL